MVDRLTGSAPQLEILRAAAGAEAVEPAAVLLPTPYGEVKVDVLEVRQVELDHPSEDPGDRLHASSHAWAHDTATEVLIEAHPAAAHAPGGLRRCPCRDAMCPSASRWCRASG